MRFRVDIFGGYAWLSPRTASAGEEFINGQSQGVSGTADHTTQSYVTLGLAARYVFSRRFDGVFEYGRARNPKTAPEGVHLEATGNKWGLTRSMSLSVRYRFNQHAQGSEASWRWVIVWKREAVVWLPRRKNVLVRAKALFALLTVWVWCSMVGRSTRIAGRKVACRLLQ